MVTKRVAWRPIMLAALQAAHAAVNRLAPAAGGRVVAGRAVGYRSWDPEVIGVDTAERAGCVVTGWDGSPVRFTPDINAVYRLVCSANAVLHREVLAALKTVRPPKGLVP